MEVGRREIFVVCGSFVFLYSLIRIGHQFFFFFNSVYKTVIACENDIHVRLSQFIKLTFVLRVLNSLIKKAYENPLL